MSLKAKYEEVLKLGEEFGVKDGYVNEEGGKLKIGGVAETAYEKNRMWDEIKKAGGESPSDIEADIKVANNAYYHKHTVKSGESLSLISKHYFRDPMKYKAIFEANKGLLDNPDVIHPGQELIIPNLG